jgi:ParB family transcriptional regulator, chromosome partitioning protein
MSQVAMIPTDQINVLNPRVRNRRQHQEIIRNIADVGLKRPITVSKRVTPLGTAQYDLVCGQGRLEAFQQLGYKEIPAFVITASESDCMVMSLVENVARRQHTTMELVREIGNLHERGYTDRQIADKTGLTANWVNMLVGLLEHGEERLIAAVETGLIPISLAVDFARSDDTGIQEALADAYAKGLKGKKLVAIRRILDQRARRGKAARHEPLRHKTSPKLTAERLRRIYEREVEKQALLAKKAEFSHSKLMFVVQAMRNLRNDGDFVALLRQESLYTLPLALAEKMTSGGAE